MGTVGGGREGLSVLSKLLTASLTSLYFLSFMLLDTTTPLNVKSRLEALVLSLLNRTLPSFIALNHLQVT